MDELICRAIAARKLLMFGYGDQVRVVEPHLYGINSAGHEALRAWLRPGLSRAEPEGGWRMYLVPEMRAPQILDEQFAGPRPGYNPNDRHMQRVLCRLPGVAEGEGESAGIGSGAGAPGVSRAPGTRSDDAAH